MKKKIITTFLLIFFFFSHSYSTELKISGTKRIDIETIKVYGDIKIQPSYTNEELNQILKNLYETNFFEDVKVSFKNNILSIEVKEYPVINSIILEGEPTNKIKDALLEDISSKEKSSYIKSNISKDIIRIKKVYEILGFNTTDVDTKVEEINEDTVNLYFFINRGSKVKIKKIRFIGDKKIRDRRLRDVIVSEEDKFWKFISRNTILNKKNIELDKRLLTNYYKSAGFYDVNVISSSATLDDKNFSTLTYNISSGKRYRINKISTNVNPALDKKVFMPLEKNFKKLVSDYYSPFKVKKLLDSLDKLISFNDLQYIEHSVNEIVGDSGIEIVLNIYEGEKSLIERINILGNTVTNEDVIRGELLVDEGDPFNKLKFNQSIARIKSRNIFESVEEKVSTGSEKDLKVIDISVEEKPTGEISAGAGVGTDGGAVQFGIKENNWLGKGIRLETSIDISDDALKGGFDYSDPNYNFSGNTLSFGFQASDSDVAASGYENKVQSANISTSFEQYTNVYISPGIVLSADKLTVDSTASDQLKKQAGSFTELAVDYSITRDERDRTFMPTNGYSASFYQQLPIFADSSSISNNFATNFYRPLSEDIIGSIKFYVAAVNGIDEDVRVNKRLFIPSNRLRGFAKGKVGPKDGKDFVGGNYSTALNLEASLPNLLPESTNADISMFIDAGNVWGVDYNGTIDNQTQKIRSSTGIAANWYSPIGPVTFTLAKAITKNSSDSTQSFKFNLGTTF